MTAEEPHHELRLLEACEALQDAVYVKDLDGRYLMVNAAAAAAVGLERDRLIGRTDRDIFPDDWEGVRQADQEVIASGASQTIEEAVVADGELRTYLSTKAPLRDSSGEILGLIGTSTDITARKAAEKELRQREAKLAEAQAVAQVGSWEWDMVRNEASWSDELYRIFGVSPDEFEPTYESFLGALHPEDRERVAAALDQSVETGGDYQTEYRVVRPDGEIRTVIARARVFCDLDGEPLRMVGAGVDITERKDSQARLEAREALLHVAQELTRAGSFEWDIAADEVSWSKELYRIFGLQPGEIPATFAGYLERVHPEEREERRRVIEQVLETRRSAEGEHRIVRPDGEVRWVESRMTVLAGKTGSPTRLVGVCQDITERKAAAAELEGKVQAAQARALRDPLTGLANRTLALDRLQHAFALAQRGTSDLAVLFVDVDGFKRVNDRYGHPIGDNALRLVAERLAESLRESDTLARIGGDEFLVLCEEAKGGLEALETAERLHAAFAAPFKLTDEADEPITISIGISSIGEREIRGADQLVKEADEAMFEAQRRGPGGVALYRVNA